MGTGAPTLESSLKFHSKVLADLHFITAADKRFG